MAERVGASPGSSTSLRGLREHLASVAQEMAEERRRKRGVNSSPAPHKKLSCTPVIDGSVLKNDIKQLLAKERREESKRQQEANKEKQLLEKERKSKLQYEKQLEEKQRKLKEQKEKDERRRVSAEEKRKQKIAEDKEKFKAVLTRTMERCNRFELRQKRWSWESSLVNTENKSGKPESRRSSSLNRRENKVQSSVDRDQMDNTETTDEFLYVSAPVFTDEELKASIMFSKSRMNTSPPTQLKLTPPRKAETSPKEDVQVPTDVNANVPSKVDVEDPPIANVEVPFQVNVEDTPEVNVEVSANVTSEVPPEVKIEGYPKEKIEEPSTVSVATSLNIELSPVVSMDSSSTTSVGSSSLVSMEISPVVSMDTSPEVSIDISPELSGDSASMEVPPAGNIETSREESTEVHLEPTVEGSPASNGEVSYEVSGEPSLKNPEMDKQTSSLTAKKQPPSNIPCYRWPSSPSISCRPSSPMKNIMQISKSRPPSPLPISSKLPAQASLQYKVPIKNILWMPKAVDIKKIKEMALQATNKREAGSQAHMAGEESGNKSMANREDVKINLVERQHPPYEQKRKEEKEGFRKEKKPSVVNNVDAVAEKTDESQAEEFPTSRHELRRKYMSKPGGCKQPEDIDQPLQKKETTIKSQDAADTRKKVYERIMLQNHQERLERKKRVEEIMKQTRKTGANASKPAETSDNGTSAEGEADDEEETESDEDSLDDLFASGIKSIKHKMFSKTAMKPQKLVFLQAKTGEIDTERKIYFNGNIKVDRPKDPKAKGSRLSTKKKSIRRVKTRKVKETNPTIRSTQSDSTNREWVCDRIEISHNAKSRATRINPGSSKQDLKTFMTSHQGPEASLDLMKRSKPVLTLSKASPQPHFTQKTTGRRLFSVSRGDFGREEEEDSD